MVCEHVQKAGSILQEWEKLHKLEHSASLQGKQTGLCRMERTHSILIVIPQKGTRSVEQEHPQKRYEKTSECLAGQQRYFFLSQGQSIKTAGGDYLFKCEDSSASVQGTLKIKERSPQKEHNNFPVSSSNKLEISNLPDREFKVVALRITVRNKKTQKDH